MKYEGSIAWASVNSSPIDQLKCAKRYYEMAINTHKSDGNHEEVEFFTDGLNIINKKIGYGKGKNRTIFKYA